MMSVKKRNACFPGQQRSVALQYTCIYRDLQTNSVQDIIIRLNNTEI